VFGGYKTTNATSATSIGGFILNIDGGSLEVGGNFKWNRNNSGNPNSIGRINITNGGTVAVGTMLPNWTGSAGNYVNFEDATGSLTFGYGNWETENAVRNLIADGF